MSANANEQLDSLLIRREKRAAMLLRLRSSDEYQHVLNLRSLNNINVELQAPTSPMNWEWRPKSTWEKRFRAYKVAIKAWSQLYMKVSSQASHGKTEA